MFFSLLATSLLLSIVLSVVTVMCFRAPLRGILTRIVGADVADHWFRFSIFVLYITGVACGVDAYNLEDYIQLRHRNDVIVPLDTEGWVFEIYRVFERTFTGLAYGMTTILVLGLIAVVVLRVFEIRSGRLPISSDTMTEARR